MQSVFANVVGKPLIILAAPSVTTPYYQEEFLDIIRFDILFSKLILGKDNILVLADKTAIPYLIGGHPELVPDTIPQDIIVEADVLDIWLRDFGTVKQRNPVKFAYQPQYHPPHQAKADDDSFLKFLSKYHINVDENKKFDSKGLHVPKYPTLMVDGGNVVYNGKDKAISTTRVVEDNKHVEDMKSTLQDVLGYENVVLITQLGNFQEDATGHADLMVSFIDENVIAVSQVDEVKHEKLMKELQNGFGDSVRIVPIPTFYINEKYVGFNSGCGIHINCLVTDDFVYMPTFAEDAESRRKGFGEDADRKAYEIIKANTRKTVIPVPVPYKIARLGGSVRCLTMQLQGPIADHLIRIGQESVHDCN